MRARAIAFLTALAAFTTVFTVAFTSPAQAAGDPGSGGCGASGYPMGYSISCQSGSGNPGAPGGTRTASDPSGPVTLPCAFYPVPGNPTHMLEVCPVGNPYGGLRYAVPPPGIPTLVPVGKARGGPPVTPQELLAWAQSELPLPLPKVRTAPPRGSDGLVGLPEYFWLPHGQWHPIEGKPVHAGAVWAQVTAVPEVIQVQPGDGVNLRCPGPGVPYTHRQAGRGACTYTYSQSSDGRAGDAYPVNVTVVWTATWRGSGGAGGALPAIGRTAGFTLPVAEAQALNPGGQG